MVAGAFLVVRAGGPTQILAHLAGDRDWLLGLVSRHGFGVALAYIAGYASLMTTLWIPAWLCTVIGGFLFGFWFGALYALIGASLGATAVFLLARSGFSGLTRGAGVAVRQLETGFRANAFSYILVLRLVPIVPFAVVNAVPAILGVPLRTYVLATVLGILPSTLIYVGIGNSLGSLAIDGATLDTDILSKPRFVVPLLGLAGLALIPVFYRLWQSRHARS